MHQDNVGKTAKKNQSQSKKHFLPETMWTLRHTVAVGGLREMGFAPDTDLLLVLSGNGRGILDCLEPLSQNVKIGRDYDSYYDTKWNAQTGLVEGFGPLLHGQYIRCGGFEAPNPLRASTATGWTTEICREMRLDYRNQERLAFVLYLVHIRNMNDEDAEDKRIEVHVLHCYLSANDYSKEEEEEIRNLPVDQAVNRAYGFSETGRSFVIETSPNLYIWNFDDEIVSK